MIDHAVFLRSFFISYYDDVYTLTGFGEGDRTMREDREDRDAYRRGPMEGMRDLDDPYRMVNSTYHHPPLSSKFSPCF